MFPRPTIVDLPRWAMRATHMLLSCCLPLSGCSSAFPDHGKGATRDTATTDTGETDQEDTNHSPDSSGDTSHETGDTGDTGDTEDTGPEPLLHAGFRASRYGIDPFPDPTWWVETGRDMASRFDGATPGGVWIVGVAGDDGTCYLNFPSPGGSWDDIGFSSEDQNEAWLDAFDEAGLELWLQVEPGDASIDDLISLVLERYGSHPSVIGFGVDVEWFRWLDHPDGKAVTDDKAIAWRDAVRAFKPDGTLFLKHWMADRMPPSEREGILFVNDGQALSSLDEMVSFFADWGETFAPAPVAFQYGYATDRPWWSRLDDPPGDIGRALIREIPNTQALFWVDFTIGEVFPP